VEDASRLALGGYKELLGKKHPTALAAVNNLASVLQDQGEYEEAEMMYRRALKRREDILGS
jgi:tetratricopeptide (TPR) repeat protein